jgi:hypothetical protein
MQYCLGNWKMSDLELTANAALKVYQARLREALEESHLNEFCAIEPISGDYFLGRTLSEAGGAARKAYPERQSHIVRIGHSAAVHIGVLVP